LHIQEEEKRLKVEKRREKKQYNEVMLGVRGVVFMCIQVYASLNLFTLTSGRKFDFSFWIWDVNR